MESCIDFSFMSSLGPGARAVWVKRYLAEVARHWVMSASSLHVPEFRCLKWQRKAPPSASFSMSMSYTSLRDIHNTIEPHYDSTFSVSCYTTEPSIHAQFLINFCHPASALTLDKNGFTLKGSSYAGLSESFGSFQGH